MYRLNYIEGDPRRYDEDPARPLAKSRTEQFRDKESALARAKVILLDGRFQLVSLSDDENNIDTELRLRMQLGLPTSSRPDPFAGDNQGFLRAPLNEEPPPDPKAFAPQTNFKV